MSAQDRRMDDATGQEQDASSEYEYDENETETFYVTLDLSSHAPSLTLKPSQSTAPQAANSNTRSTDSPTAAEGSTDVQNEASTQLAENSHPENQDQDANAKLDHTNHIQFLDLPSKNPIILYQGQTYSCRWGSTIGTDVFIGSRLPEADDTYDPPIQGNPEAYLVGLASTRLTARPVQAVIKTETDNTGAAEAQSRRTATESSHSSARAKQSAFLERLAAIKASKGETDMVPTSTQPSNRKPQSETSKSPGRGGKRRARGRRRGGLFRDYQPQAGDEPGADIRASFVREQTESLITPEDLQEVDRLRGKSISELQREVLAEAEEEDREGDEEEQEVEMEADGRENGDEQSQSGTVHADPTKESSTGHADVEMRDA